MWLFLLLVAVPIIEIGLFIQVGGFLGLWPTLAIVVLTAAVGTTMMRAQGVSTLQRLQSSLETGKNPADPIANGAFILIAGLLLLTPGFFTDSIGLALLFPPFRHAIVKAAASRIKASSTTYSAGFSSQAQYGSASDAVLDGEFEVVNDNENTAPGNSGWTRPEE